MVSPNGSHKEFISAKIPPATNGQLSVLFSWKEVCKIHFLMFQPSYLIASPPHPDDNWIPVGCRPMRDKQKEAIQAPAGKHPHCLHRNDLRCELDDSEIKKWANVPLHSAVIMQSPRRALVTSSFIWQQPCCSFEELPLAVERFHICHYAVFSHFLSSAGGKQHSVRRFDRDR